MFGLLLILFTIVPALEFYLLFKIGSQLGAMTTFSIIIATGVVGAYLARAQGLSIINKVQTELGANHLPAQQLLHGFIVFGGGLLLLTPGFLTDILGFSMVLPGSRHIIVTFLKSYFEKGIANGNIKFMGGMSSTMNSSNKAQGFYHSSNNNMYNTQVEEEAGPESDQSIEAEFKRK